MTKRIDWKKKYEDLKAYTNDSILMDREVSKLMGDIARQRGKALNVMMNEGFFRPTNLGELLGELYDLREWKKERMEKDERNTDNTK